MAYWKLGAIICEVLVGDVDTRCKPRAIKRRIKGHDRSEDPPWILV